MSTITPSRALVVGLGVSGVAAATLLAYHRAALARSRAFFPTLSRKDLDRELNEPWFQPLPTVGVRLISVLADNLEHAGQAAYVRGVLQGKGWQPF